MTRRALAAVLGLAAVLAAAPAAPAQSRQGAPAQRSPFLEGTHAFRRILYDVAGQKNLGPLTAADGWPEPQHMLIVVLGAPRPLELLDQPPGRLRWFVENGGALLVATDQRTPRVLGDSFGVGVTGVLLTLSDANDENAYRRMRECPYLQPEPGVDPALFEPARPVLRGASPKIASNLPSCLIAVPRPPARGLLASLPAGCVGADGQRAPSQSFAVGGSLDKGRLLIMADHSVFINEMMLQPDNGNIDFAYRCADWLLAGPAGRRNRVLYYEDGAVRTDFDIPLKSLPPPPLPPPDSLLGMVDEALHGMEQDGTFLRLEEDVHRLEENDSFNGAVADVMDGLPFWEWAGPGAKVGALALIAASVGLGLYAFVRLGAFRHRPDAAGPALAALLGKQAPAGALLEQRQAALLRAGHLGEAARDLARQLFASAGVSPGAGPPPGLEVRGPWWQRWRVRRQWRQLWRLAGAARPARVSPGGLARLAARAQALQVAIADGTVRVSPGVATPGLEDGGHS